MIWLYLNVVEVVVARKERFWSKKRPEEIYDAIVIGSGMGGMTTAAMLSKLGKKVLVLEQHYVPGGFTHTFRRKGYEWDVGVHYIGGVGSPETSTYKLFDHVTGGALRWVTMGDVYDRIAIGDQPALLLIEVCQ